MTNTTITETLTAAGIEKVSEAMKLVFTALTIADAELSEAEIMEAAGTKRTATGIALAELVAKGLIYRVDGHGTGKNRVPNQFGIVVAETKAEKKAKKSAKKDEEKTDGTETAPATGEPRYGKAMIRVWDFMKAHEGEQLKVSEIVNGLAELGENTWYNATNQALKALAARPTGVSKVEDAKANTYIYMDV